MADPAWLLSPLVWFALLVGAGWLLYLWGRRLAPAGEPSPEKLGPYVGGERAPLHAPAPGYGFYHVALFFTLMHIAALVVATAPPDRVSWGAVSYLGVVSLSVVLLRWNP